MTDVILSLGSNMGNRLEFLKMMRDQLLTFLSAPVIESDIMDTEPVEVLDEQNNYLNMIVRGMFDGSSRDLLNICLSIESELGRNRMGYHTARTADIDILFFGKKIINESDLIIPHRAIINRRFCLEGLKQVAEDFFHPVLNKTISDLYDNMSGNVLSQKISFIH